MGRDAELVTLEREGWIALSTSAQDARRFYADVIADDAVMILPGGLVLQRREDILDAFGAAPWSRYDIEATRVLEFDADIAGVVYEARAQRGDDAQYHAWFTSLYRRLDGRWKLVLHQQTPV